MSLIFNNDYFSSTLADLEYDANKMPLGKLSKKTLLQGYEVLKDLSTLIGSGGSGGMIEERSNAYFSLIPHAYGRNRVPVLSRMDMLKKEVELLEALTDMQLANEIMKTAKNDKVKQEEKVAMVDRQYEGLGMQEMTPLDHKSNEYKELEDYLVKSAGKTHYIKYEVEDIFRIERQGEGSRFKSSKFGRMPDSKSDRRLLWHGSRTTNYGGILSQGLRIAPPEAPGKLFVPASRSHYDLGCLTRLQYPATCLAKASISPTSRQNRPITVLPTTAVTQDCFFCVKPSWVCHH